MRAWVLHRHGAPADALALREVPDPEPGAGQVCIRSEGFGLNMADAMAVRGLYREAPPPPCVLGYEVVGRVERCGPGVPGALEGRRVAAICRFGGQAERVVTDHRALTVVPEAMDLGVALTLTTQGCTAWYMATMAFPLRGGHRVLVHSAAGGVGQWLVQLAVHRGCEVFAVASGTDKCATLRSWGAAHAIDRTRMDHADAVRAIVGKDGLDVSFNAVAGTTFKKDLALLAAGGAVVLFGGAQRTARHGPLGTLRFVWDMGLIVPILLMMRSRSVIGVNMLRIGEQRPAVLAECLRATAEAVEQGIVSPHVHRTYAAEELPAALEELGGATIGKLALRW